ncbi:MAG TPA: nucleotide exchange factor GrpE [Ktedonobacterales bacterium]
MADEQSAATASESAMEAAAPAAPVAPTEAAAQDASAAARVAELERQVAELERQVERERDQATEYMRHWHTAQADFANFKRRAQQEQEQRDRVLAAQALAPALHALDSLERAFLALPATLRSYTWIEGIALVELQLRRALELQGIRVVAAAPGQAFDPTRHEPIGEVETEEYAEGAIAVVAQSGYESQGLLIRPALVQLARRPAQPHVSPESADNAASAASAASADNAGATDGDENAATSRDDATEATSST